MHIVSSILHQIRLEKHRSGLIQPLGNALDRRNSGFLLTANIDFARFTSHNISILLNCGIKSISSSCIVARSCQMWHRNGLKVPVEEIPQVIQLTKAFSEANAFRSRAGVIGYLEELNWFRLKPDIEEKVNGMVLRIRKEKLPNADSRLLGLHRRSVDGLCYRWLAFQSRIKSRGFLDCHSHSKWVRDSKVSKASFDGTRCEGTPNHAYQMNQTHIDCYFQADPQYSLCDVMFSDFNKAYFRNVSPEFPRDENYVVIFATDKQRPQGDAELKKNLPNRTISLAELDANLTKIPGNQLMIIEMWALAQTDYFVAQPLSSCETIIMHWRYALFGISDKMSFPPDCYEIYNQERLNGTNTVPVF